MEQLMKRFTTGFNVSRNVLKLKKAYCTGRFWQ